MHHVPSWGLPCESVERATKIQRVLKSPASPKCKAPSGNEKLTFSESKELLLHLLRSAPSPDTSAVFTFKAKVGSLNFPLFSSFQSCAKCGWPHSMDGVEESLRESAACPFWRRWSPASAQQQISLKLPEVVS